MKQYHSKHTAVLSTRGFYTILTVCALIIAASAWVLWSDATAPADDELQASLPIVTPAEQLPDLTEDTPVLSEDTGETDEAEPTDAAEETQPEEADDTAAETADPAPAPVETVSAPVYVRPVSGAVITPFSGDELLFQPTFGDWRVHTGTDFAAEAGETVMALTDGTVQKVVEDGLYGTCVTLSHDADLLRLDRCARRRGTGRCRRRSARHGCGDHGRRSGARPAPACRDRPRRHTGRCARTAGRK